MNLFQFPENAASTEEITQWMHCLEEHFQQTPNPNECGANGRTLLQMALLLCSSAGKEKLAIDLLDRGANPNKPTPWTIFTSAMTSSNSTRLISKLIECGLELNRVFEEKHESRLTDGPATLLDYACGLRDYLSPKHRGRTTLARKHAGGIGKRRQFIEDTIELLESHGAKRARDVL
jgi:hypothetical protein